MANTNLTVDQVTNHALMVLHQKLNFVGTINRQYDDSYKTSGAKGGDSIRIRLPNEYVVREGKTLNVQDTSQRSVTLQTATQRGVDMNFSMQELTQDINLFNENFIEPAMSVLAANIERDAMNMYKDVYQEISELDAAITLVHVLSGAKKLTDSLAYGKRCLNMNTRDNADLVAALSALFNDPAKVSENYREGMVANQFVGYSKVYENTLWPIHLTGTDDGTGDYLTDGAVTEGQTTIVIDTGAGTWNQGDIFYFLGINSVHPETKDDTGERMKFVVTADASANATALSISPAVRASGGSQNVVSLPGTGIALEKQESDDTQDIGASADYNISMGYQENAFAFATADLEQPEGVHFAARKVLDGISLRIVRDYDINNDNMPTRIDILYGYQTIRAQLAVRYGFN